MVVDTFRKLKSESGQSSEAASKQLQYLRAMYAPALSRGQMQLDTRDTRSAGYDMVSD